MARREVVFDGELTKKFVVNHKRGSNYSATIQNNTDQSITITVTNQNIQSPTPAFATPPTALVILSGAILATTEPFDGWLITAALAATGTVDIVEAG